MESVEEQRRRSVSPEFSGDFRVLPRAQICVPRQQCVRWHHQLHAILSYRTFLLYHLTRSQCFANHLPPLLASAYGRQETDLPRGCWLRFESSSRQLPVQQPVRALAATLRELADLMHAVCSKEQWTSKLEPANRSTTSSRPSCVTLTAWARPIALLAASTIASCYLLHD